MNTTIDTGENKITSIEKLRGKCRSHLKHRLLSENPIYDPLNVFAKQIENIKKMIMRKYLKKI